MNQENNPIEAQLIYEQILIKEKSGNESEIANLASLSDRFAAFLVDALILAVPIFTIVSIVFGFNKIIEMAKEHTLLYSLVMLLVGQIFYFSINGWLLYKYGQTFGKKFLEIKIVELNNNLPELYRSYGLRYFVPALFPLLPFLGGLLSMADILFIFRKDRRCIHDHLAGTKVISVT
jgi:uncharacterized RDD family membrane protein YckC